MPSSAPNADIKEDKNKGAAKLKSGNTCLFAGIREDGSLLTKVGGLNDYNIDDLSCNIERNDLAQIVPCGNSFRGLSLDGDECSPGYKLSNLASIEEDWFLRTDGTVIFTDSMRPGYTSRVQSWCDLIQISGNENCTVGLKSDGSVVYTDKNNNERSRQMRDELSEWRDIVAVRASRDSVLGVKRDGSLVAAGKDFRVFLERHPDFRMFDDIETFGAELSKRRKAAFSTWKEVEEPRIAEINRIRTLCKPLEEELDQIYAKLSDPYMSGWVAIKKRKELEHRARLIRQELSKLPSLD